MSIPEIHKYTKDYLELRIKGSGTSGKGDRTELLTAKNARMLAINLLTTAEQLGMGKL